ncbi:hypothetical protein CC80DRAFT_94810 [Byssothecium circinans]|uniref:EthD domain-containing protein n=1 Tax=Byssothecium circinans TaxID=147558 RepID=A0A6A5TSN6_9PLEO|nr:hypothetical protein CC80DRAFT_94810 [Byssothecium circinans]
MFFNVLIFGLRAPNLTHAEYKSHYETIHVPLAQSLAGSAWPLSHTRYYAGGNATLAAISYPVDWDSMAVLSFRDETHAFTFQKVLGQPEASKKIHDDEALFMDFEKGSPRMVVVGMDVGVTYGAEA